MAAEKTILRGSNKLFNMALNTIKQKDCIDLIEKTIKTALVIDKKEALSYLEDVFAEIFEDNKVTLNFIKYLRLDAPLASNVKVNEENEQIYIKVDELRILYKPFVQDIKVINETPLVLKSFVLSGTNKGQTTLTLTRMDGLRGSFIMEQEALIAMLTSLINYSEKNYITEDFIESDPEVINGIADNMANFIEKINTTLNKEVAFTEIDKE